MENLIDRIKLGEWNYYSKNGDISDLKKYGINDKNISEIAEKIFSVINGNNDSKNDEKRDILGSDYKIKELAAYFQALNTLMVHQLKVKIWLSKIESIKPDKKIDELIKAKTERLKERFGIIVENVNDLEHIEKEIQRRLDKREERFGFKEKVKEGITFSELVIGVFNALDKKIDYEMILSDFILLKDRALNNG